MNISRVGIVSLALASVVSSKAQFFYAGNIQSPVTATTSSNAGASVVAAGSTIWVDCYSHGLSNFLGPGTLSYDAAACATFVSLDITSSVQPYLSAMVRFTVEQESHCFGAGCDAIGTGSASWKYKGRTTSGQTRAGYSAQGASNTNNTGTALSYVTEYRLMVAPASFSNVSGTWTSTVKFPVGFATISASAFAFGGTAGIASSDVLTQEASLYGTTMVNSTQPVYGPTIVPYWPCVPTSESHPATVTVVRNNATIDAFSVGLPPSGNIETVVDVTIQSGDIVRIRPASGLSKIVTVNGTTWNCDMILGDVDQSDEIDAGDIDLVINFYGSTPSDLTWSDSPDDEPCGYDADVDGSGEVDAADIDAIVVNFGEISD